MPAGRVVGLVIESAVHEMVMEKEPLALAPRESVTLRVPLVVPMVVGVPEITPALEMERPAGSEPAVSDQV